MYLVTVYNSGHPTVIHGDFCKVADCKITREVNATDAMTFTIYPGNPGYSAIVEFATKISCIDTGTGEVAFEGRILSASASMDADGASCKSVTCEGLRGYLNDSVQPYTEEKTWDGDTSRNGLQEFIDYLLGNHNAHVAADMRIYRGIVDVQTFKTTENVTKGTNYERTLEAIKSKIIDVFGGESQVRRGDDGKLYFDYREKLGTAHSEKISVGRNIASAKREIKPDQLITRLYPRGAKVTKTETDESGAEREVETEDRVTIASVNGGVEYIDDDEAVKLYGIIEGVNEWDDVTEPLNLRSKAETWLKSNNQLPVSTTIDGYDLSMLGYEADRIRLHGWYPCYDPLVGLDENLEVVKQTVNVSEPAESTWEFGETKATHTAILSSLNGIASAVEYVKSKTLTNVVNIGHFVKYVQSSIEIAEESITSTVSERLDNFGGEEGITVECKYSQIKQSVDSIESTVYSIDESGEKKSKIEQLADSIDTMVEEGYPYTDDSGKKQYVKTSISNIQQTASSITTQVTQLQSGYGTCTTAAATAAKTVSIDGFKTLHSGATVCVKYTYANEAANPTLNVSGTGAKPIALNGKAIEKSGWWSAGDVATMVYDGTCWNLSDSGAHSKIKQTAESIESIVEAGYPYTDKTTQQTYSITSIKQSVDSIESTVYSIDESGEKKSKIEQLADSISLNVSGSLGGKASITLSVDGVDQAKTIDMSGVRNAFKNDTSAIAISAGTVTFNSNTFVVDSTYFKVTSSGVMTATSGTIGGLNIASSSIYNDAMTLDSNGLTFKYGGSAVGKIGTNRWSTDASKRGLVFDLEYGAAYMCWACAESSSASSYTVVMAYANKKVGDLDAGKLHVTVPMQVHSNIGLNNYIAYGFWIDPNSGGCNGGISGTVSFVKVNSMDSDGTASNWTNGCSLTFKNGMLTGGTW